METRSSSGLLNQNRIACMNDSVIICDPTPKKNVNPKSPNTRGKRIIRRLPSDINPNNELTTKRRTPLRTVYESTSGRGKQNTCNNSTMVVNLAAKRLRRKSSNAKSPKKKKQKTDNDTIIIVTDDESDASVNSHESDVILVNDSIKVISPKVKKTVEKSQKKKKKRNSKDTEIKNNEATVALRKEDDEDIAVVWASTSGEKNSQPVEKTNLETNRKHDGKQDPSNMFFIDTVGDRNNLKKHSLDAPVEPTPVAAPNIQCKPPSVPPPKIKKAKAAKIDKADKHRKKKLREIVVDGCNVAFGHSHQNTFSPMGLKLVWDYFRKRGHVVKIFLPQHQRKRDREYLEDWYRQGAVIFTPSRNIGGKAIVPYDDRFIIDYATKCKGIIVSSDQYRDLWEEKPEWRETIEKRLIAPTFVGDYVMFPEDPLGRTGPKLDKFLRH